MKKTTPEILRELRKQKGVTQGDIAKLLGFSTTAYQNYERGINEPSNKSLCKLADFYNVTTDYLLGREPQSPNPILQLTQEEMERRLVAAYFSLPQKLRDEFLHSMAEELEKQGEIVETTTVGAELDRMAQSDAEAKDDAG